LHFDRDAACKFEPQKPSRLCVSKSFEVLDVHTSTLSHRFSKKGDPRRKLSDGRCRELHTPSGSPRYSNTDDWTHRRCSKLREQVQSRGEVWEQEEWK
jgi:hypothetical protein